MKNWLQILIRVKNSIKDNHITLVAAAMSYYALFALVPAITSLILTYAWVSDPKEIVLQIDKIAFLMPVEMQNFLKSQLVGLASKAPNSIGIGAMATLLFSLWSASKGSKAVMEALNIIYHEKEQRKLIKRAFISLALTFLGVILAIISLSGVIIIPAAFSFFHLKESLKFLVTLSTWIVLLGVFSFYLACMYRIGPNRNLQGWKGVRWGAMVASIFWLIVSALFSWYASKFAHFNKTYGSLGAIIGVMTWFYITSFIILMGAQLNAELEKFNNDMTTSHQ
ncbi:MAG: YihY/virulence factor BrkB family protein [Bacteriovoracaceae bacterium]